jgi:hypothetical protein
MRVQFTKKDWDEFPKQFKMEIEGKSYLCFMQDDMGYDIMHPVDFVERYVNLTVNKENKQVLDKFFSKF